MLDGSSSLNSMLYIRGAAQDYDDWRDLGCTGWGWDDVLPVIKALERNRLGDRAGRPGTAAPERHTLRPLSAPARARAHRRHGGILLQTRHAGMADTPIRGN